MKNFALKKSLNEKVTRVPSSREGPNCVTVIYINETESEKDQVLLSIVMSNHGISMNDS